MSRETATSDSRSVHGKTWNRPLQRVQCFLFIFVDTRSDRRTRTVTIRVKYRTVCTVRFPSSRECFTIVPSNRQRFLRLAINYSWNSHRGIPKVPRENIYLLLVFTPGNGVNVLRLCLVSPIVLQQKEYRTRLRNR